MNAKAPQPSGILLLDKQPGMTSFDCIRSLKRSWRRTDLGHGGTLDMFASGLLPVLAGEALKLARFFLESYPALPTYWKTYEGVFEMGRSTETGDPEGAVLETRDPGVLTVERIQAAMTEFVGKSYDQTPPRYSAKKIGGERSSDLARAGVEAELKAVPVTVRSFTCTGVEGNLVRFSTECSKGTYVRVLATDLARKLDTVAHVRELRRTAVGTFTLGQAVRLDAVQTPESSAGLLDMKAATAFLPPFPLLGGELEQLAVGRTDGVAARLANSGLEPNVYCAHARSGPVGLFELSPARHWRFSEASKLKWTASSPSRRLHGHGRTSDETRARAPARRERSFEKDLGQGALAQDQRKGRPFGLRPRAVSRHSL